MDGWDGNGICKISKTLLEVLWESIVEDYGLGMYGENWKDINVEGEAKGSLVTPFCRVLLYYNLKLYDIRDFM